eukprot:CAMPEP_0184671572 /NCGR_PEP_ID=MMETSP0308-20130426/85582_1 /TAXON_ID=38269 /ORGANISM="Gloeochaete witrockiana, Strain SAG 46.84" /LENGTH=263 /DNA_ID=CAMNT_0027118733 /DNA_START=827 /DNA_END=1619 /DNA_ORIENTATION=+
MTGYQVTHVVSPEHSGRVITQLEELAIRATLLGETNFSDGLAVEFSSKPVSVDARVLLIKIGVGDVQATADLSSYFKFNSLQYYIHDVAGNSSEIGKAAQVEIASAHMKFWLLSGKLQHPLTEKADGNYRGGGISMMYNAVRLRSLLERCAKSEQPEPSIDHVDIKTLVNDRDLHALVLECMEFPPLVNSLADDLQHFSPARLCQFLQHFVSLVSRCYKNSRVLGCGDTSLMFGRLGVLTCAHSILSLALSLMDIDTSVVMTM